MSAGGAASAEMQGGATRGAPCIDVLVPTCARPAALAVTLASIGAQDWPALRVIVSDQSHGRGALAAPEVVAVLRYLQARGHKVNTWQHLPRRGMAEQRAFLLSQVRAAWCLFVDDDVILEPDLVRRLHATLVAHGCGFAGSAVHGLSYRGQLRPAEEDIAFWDGRVAPETVVPGSRAWRRHRLHSAANLFHLQSRAGGDAGPDAATRAYRVAWVGGCVLFDTAKLRAVGGFDFWPELPDAHCGEDVLAQLRVMQAYGGCGVFPSGAYHMELPTTLKERMVDAPLALEAWRSVAEGA
ncbi:glycosyltransferase family A protein [Massilia sp. YIM B02443]|uniref:glycosyltransferase family 2 protein n=1 Tax=Massilia sp. YIM B02443 TaxID=3050127 RepID=UPI0025B72B01|nr:glycosyltransferase family A protein [Massilia sp. YIM B02443]MDN4038842.1 glycosyltransferase family A protein [Massilia sp. YIM B02443]